MIVLRHVRWCEQILHMPAYWLPFRAIFARARQGWTKGHGTQS